MTPRGEQHRDSTLRACSGPGGDTVPRALGIEKKPQLQLSSTKIMELKGPLTPKVPLVNDQAALTPQPCTQPPASARAGEAPHFLSRENICSALPWVLQSPLAHLPPPCWTPAQAPVNPRHLLWGLESRVTPEHMNLAQSHCSTHEHSTEQLPASCKVSASKPAPSASNRSENSQH